VGCLIPFETNHLRKVGIVLKPDKLRPRSIAEPLPNPDPTPDGWPPPMTDEAKYGIAGEFLQAVEPCSEADPQALLAQLYAGFGNLVGSGPHFMVENTRHGTNLFVATVGDTAKARKGTAWDRDLDVLRRVDNEWATSRVESGLSTGEGVVNAVRDGSPPDDPGVQDKRVLFFEGDFCRPLRAMERPGNTLSPILRKCWDGGDLRVLTKTSPLKATGAHVSIVAQTTRYELLQSLGKAEMIGGLGNRFLCICARRAKLLPFGGNISGAALLGISERLKSAAASARQMGRMRLSTKARRLWGEEYPRLSAASPGLLGVMTSRAEPQVLRLAAVSALMNQSDKIQTQHLRAGLAIWSYSLASARFLFGDKQETKLDSRLLRILRESQGGLTRTRISAALNHHADADAIGSALERLKVKGLAKSKKKTTEGRSAELWFAISKEKSEKTPN
jgi:hypothetical protein